MTTKNKSKGKAKSLVSNREIYEKIGKRLKVLRLKAGYTAAEKFAYENEIGRSQYANYEKGVDMKISSLIKLLNAHNITIADFFAEGF